MKKCSRCKEFKPLNEFYKNRSECTGYNYACKQCSRKTSINFYKTKKGIITLMYNTQKQSSKERGHIMPEYTKSQFKEWIIEQKIFHILFDRWVKSNYKSDLKPSVDRINPNIHYRLDNIQLMTWGENNLKGNINFKNGNIKFVKNNIFKSVLQYDLNGNFIKEYISIANAARDTGLYQTNISKVCSGKLNKTGGYIWKYKQNGNI